MCGYKPATSITITTGTHAGGTVGNLHRGFSGYYRVEESGGTIDFYIEYDLGAFPQVGEVQCNGRVTGTGSSSIDIYAWNWGSSSWDQLSDSSTDFDVGALFATRSLGLSTAHYTSLGKVRIRFHATGADSGNECELDWCVVSQRRTYSTIELDIHTYSPFPVNPNPCGADLIGLYELTPYASCTWRIDLDPAICDVTSMSLSFDGTGSAASLSNPRWSITFTTSGNFWGGPNTPFLNDYPYSNNNDRYDCTLDEDEVFMFYDNGAGFDTLTMTVKGFA
jgi:hypothetical protein